MVPIWSWLVDHYVIDLWSLYHLLTWGAAALFVQLLRPLEWRLVLLLSLVSGYGWEIGETHLEKLHHAQWTEPFLNRWVSDPFFDVAGSFAGWFLAILILKVFAQRKRR